MRWVGGSLEALAAPRHKRRRSQRREVEEAAASFYADALFDGWQEAVAGRAANFVGQRTWGRVTRGWHGFRCKPLARLARMILTGKHELHDAVGAGTYKLWGWLGRPRIERVFAREVAERVPLPTDHPLITAARAVQVTGIFICVAAGRDLAECECFIDVVKNEGKERIKQLMLAAVQDWKELGRLEPAPKPGVDKPYGAPRAQLIRAR